MVIEIINLRYELCMNTVFTGNGKVMTYLNKVGYIFLTNKILKNS